MDLKELNDAIAVQVIYCRDRLGVPDERLNVDGDAIGRPQGVTGARLVGPDLIEGNEATSDTWSSPCASAAWASPTCLLSPYEQGVSHDAFRSHRPRRDRDRLLARDWASHCRTAGRTRRQSRDFVAKSGCLHGSCDPDQRGSWRRCGDRGRREHLI